MLCGVFFFTAYMDVCIFAHNLCLCEGWRRCTTLLWAATRSWSHCCWRRRQQWILKTTKVQYQMFVMSSKHHHSCVEKRDSGQETITSKHEKKNNVLFRGWSRHRKQYKFEPWAPKKALVCLLVFMYTHLTVEEKNLRTDGRSNPSSTGDLLNSSFTRHVWKY